MGSGTITKFIASGAAASAQGGTVTIGSLVMHIRAPTHGPPAAPPYAHATAPFGHQ